jgi:hypothetical protein
VKALRPHLPAGFLMQTDPFPPCRGGVRGRDSSAGGVPSIPAA